MRQNNIPVATGHLTENGPSLNSSVVIGAACALGQCAINLGVHPSGLQEALSTIWTSKGSNLATIIIGLNDSFRKNPKQAANEAQKLLTAEQLAQEIRIPTQFSVVQLKDS